MLHTLNARYRQDDAKRQTAGIKFTHRPKISIFAPQGRLVARIHVKFSTTDGPLGRTKFHPNQCTVQKRPLTTMQSLGGDQTTLAGCGAKKWCLYVLPAGRPKLSGVSRYLNLLTGRKSAFPALVPIDVKFGTAEGHVIRLAVQNFTPIGTRGGNAAPKMARISTFW